MQRILYLRSSITIYCAKLTYGFDKKPNLRYKQILQRKSILHNDLRLNRLESICKPGHLKIFSPLFKVKQAIFFKVLNLLNLSRIVKVALKF